MNERTLAKPIPIARSTKRDGVSPKNGKAAVVIMCPNQIKGRHNSLLSSMRDLRVYLKINNKTTLVLVCVHNENTHVNCLPTSLSDHFVKQQVLVICLILG